LRVQGGGEGEERRSPYPQSHPFGVQGSTLERVRKDTRQQFEGEVAGLLLSSKELWENKGRVSANLQLSEGTCGCGRGLRKYTMEPPGDEAKIGKSLLKRFRNRELAKENR